MMAQQREHGIAWTDMTWNPLTGCTKVSPGCKHCYAERIFPRPYPGRRFTDVRIHPDRLEQPLHWRKPRKIFVNSMSDLFHEQVPDEFIDKMFAVMGTAHWHVFQILTKRPDRMLRYCGLSQHEREERYLDIGEASREMFPPPFSPLGSAYSPLPNVWLGVSVENQATANTRIPLLLQTPAAVRFLSIEPLLSDIDLGNWLYLCPECDGAGCARKVRADCFNGYINHGIHWVICGGESGPHARPMQEDWARSLMQQCKEAGVPFF